MSSDYYVYRVVVPGHGVYFGQTKNPRGRWHTHRCEIKSQVEHPFYIALKAVGFDNCRLEILAFEMTHQQAVELETALINSRPDVLNVSMSGEKFMKAPGSRPKITAARQAQAARKVAETDARDPVGAADRKRDRMRTAAYRAKKKALELAFVQSVTVE
jgi:hypothetical protein